MKRIQIDFLAHEAYDDLEIAASVVNGIIEAGYDKPDISKIKSLKHLLEYCRDELGLVNWQHINRNQPLQQIILYDNDERWAK